MDRTQRHWLPRLAVAPALLIPLGFMSSHARGQTSDRFAVLIPAFTSQTDAKSKFGKDLAKEVGKLIDDFLTHKQLDNGVLRDALKEFGLKEEELGEQGCIKARQLAIRINVNLVMCGTFEGTKDDYAVRTQIIAPSEDETYDLQEFRASDTKVAAQRIADEFGNWIVGLQSARNCADYVDSQNWPSAIDQCTKAVDSSPSKGRIYMLSYAQWQSGDREAAYQGFRKVLELDPQNQPAIKALGILATEMDRPEEGIEYFRQYISYNPGDRLVRLTVANDAAKAGNFEAALEIIEEGLTGDDANNVDLLETAGIYALNAANRRIADNNNAMTDAARPLFTKALEYLDQVHAQKGSGMDVGLVRNIIQANRLMDRDSTAIAFARHAIDDPAYSGDAGLWSTYANVLNDAGRQDEAFHALERVAALEPDFGVNLRRASWMLDAGNVDAAVPAIRAGLQNSEIAPQQADVLAQKIAVAALNKAKASQFQVAIDHCDTAGEFAASTAARTLLAFVKGYSIYSIADERAKAQTLESARTTLPMFQQVIQLMNAAAGNPQIDKNRLDIIDKATQNIEIQQLIIKRGR